MGEQVSPNKKQESVTMSNEREMATMKIKAIVADVTIAMGRLGVVSIVSEIQNDDGQCKYAVDVVLGQAVKVTLSVVGQYGNTMAIILDSLNVLYMNVTSAWDGQLQAMVQSVVSSIESVVQAYGFDDWGTMAI